MLRAIVIVCCVMAAKAFVFGNLGNAVSILLSGSAPRTVTELDDSKYLGRWYQVSWPWNLVFVSVI